MGVLSFTTETRRFTEQQSRNKTTIAILGALVVGFDSPHSPQRHQDTKPV
jgi:hypothetical protein